MALHFASEQIYIRWVQHIFTEKFEWNNRMKEATTKKNTHAHNKYNTSSNWNPFCSSQRELYVRWMYIMPLHFQFNYILFSQNPTAIEVRLRITKKYVYCFFSKTPRKIIWIWMKNWVEYEMHVMYCDIVQHSWLYLLFNMCVPNPNRYLMIFFTYQPFKQWQILLKI